MVEDGSSPSLFDRVLVVSFNAANQKPEVTYTFPPPTTQGNAKDTLADSVSDFCYPESHSELLAKVNSNNYASETFSFVLTDSLGGKTYGYCRRFKAENVLECFCILSHIPSFSLFSQILDIVESRRKVSTSLVYTFLKTVLAQIFPAPGQTLSVKTFSASKNGEMDVYNLTRPADEYLTTYVSFYNLFQNFEVEDILKVWEYLLCERRVIFCSKNLGTLSSCIYALCALLYPFSWQHIFIPILPQSLIHFVTAPMPFLVGILSSSKSSLHGFPLDEVIMLDLDDKEFTLDYPFERVLPLPQFCTLKNNLRKLLRSGKKDKEFDQECAKYFLLFFYSIFKDYKKFITPAKPLPPVPVQEVKEAPTSKKKPIKKRNPKGEFDRVAFIKSHNEESTQKFLELFGSSQMFETFILEREEMAVIGSASIPDCHFLTLCGENLRENEYTGTVECEKCGKGILVKHCCAYESYHFHPACFECKKCHSTLVYDDFNSVVVQINATAQDPANKVRMVCTSCEQSKEGSGSGGGSAASFLKRMKHAVAKKIGPSESSSNKKEEEKAKPATPPPVHTPSPQPHPLPKPPQTETKEIKEKEKEEKVELPASPAAQRREANTRPELPASPGAVRRENAMLALPPSPGILRRDPENEKRISVALQGQMQAVQNSTAARQSIVPDLAFYKSKFKSMQLHREPAMLNIKLAHFFEPKPEQKIAPKMEKRRSKSDIFPINEKIKQQAAKISFDDNSITPVKEEENEEKGEISMQSDALQEEPAKPPSSPKPLPAAPRFQRNKLVPPNPAILNLNLEGARSESRGASGDATSPAQSPTAATQPTNPPFTTKPRSGSGTTPRANGLESAANPATKPRSGSFNRGQLTTPTPNATQTTNPSPLSVQTTTHMTPAEKPKNPPVSGISLGKPRSGSVGRPSVAPSVNGVPQIGQPKTAASSVAAAFRERPRSGSVGRPVNPREDVPTLMSQHRHRSPLPNSTPQQSGPSSQQSGPNTQQPAFYKPPVPTTTTAKAQTKPKQLPVPPATTSTPRGENSTPRSDTSTPRGENSTPRSETSTPRGENSTPRSEASTPRGENSTPRSETSTPRGETTTTTSNSYSKPSPHPTTQNQHFIGNKPKPQPTPSPSSTPSPSHTPSSSLTPSSSHAPSPAHTPTTTHTPSYVHTPSSSLTPTPPSSARSSPAASPLPSPTPPRPTTAATGSKLQTHPVPILTKSKSVPDSRKSTNIVMDEPPSQKCALCKKPFGSPSDPPDTPYRIVSTNDAYYHPACFVCAHCGKTIETAYVTRERLAYHRDCAASIANTCSVCNKPILSQYLEFNGRIIHKECFVCVSCKEPLAKMGSKYVELDGNSYCLECTKNRPTK